MMMMMMICNAVYSRSVRPSLRLSVKRVICGKTEESSQDFYTIQPSFLRRRWGRPEIFGQTDLAGVKGIADFQSVCARSASAKKFKQEAIEARSSINTNRKFATRFPMSLRWTSYIPLTPKRDSKTQNGRFLCKIALRLKKVCNLCENHI